MFQVIIKRRKFYAYLGYFKTIADIFVTFKGRKSLNKYYGDSSFVTSMNDIKLFGEGEVASKGVKEEKMYYEDHEVIRKTKKNRTFIYILGAALLLSVAGLGFYDYMQDKNFSENLQSLKTSLSQEISNVSQRLNALVVRVVNLERRMGILEKKTDENTSQIGKAQQDVTTLQQGLQDTDNKVATLQYTEKDAERIAVMFASQFNGIKVKTYDFNSSTNRWEIEDISFDEESPARRVSTEVVNVTKTETGYDVVLLLGYKGFNFTNGTLYFQMTVAVGSNGSIDGYGVIFSHD